MFKDIIKRVLYHLPFGIGVAIENFANRDQVRQHMTDRVGDLKLK